MSDSISTPEKVVMNVAGSQIRAETEHGAAAVQLITHPPCEMPTSFCGYPDNSSANVVILQTKGVTNIPLTLTTANSATATTTEQVSKVMLLSPSGGKVASYVFFWSPSRNGWVQPISYAGSASYPAVANAARPSVNNAGYNWLNWLQDVSVFRTVAKSQTSYLNSTAVSNQGDVAVAKFKPSIIYGNNLAQLVNFHKDDVQSIQSLRKALGAIDPNKVKFSNLRLEDDYCDVAPKEYSYEYIFQILEVDRSDAIITPIPNSNGYSSSFRNLLCDTISDVMNLSSKSTMRLAKEGSFDVHVPTGPVLEWQSTSSGSAFYSPTPSLSGPVISLLRNRQGNTYTYMPLYSEDISTTATLSASFAGDVPWNNMDWSVTIYDGLTVPVGGPTITGAPYLTVKTYNVHELQPQFGSSLRAFQRMRPPPDETAIKIITTIFHSRPDSLPASANDLGTIAATAIKYLPTAVGWLKDLFGGAKQKQRAMDEAVQFVSGRNTKKQLDLIRAERNKAVKALKAANEARNKANTAKSAAKRARNKNVSKPRANRPNKSATEPAPILPKVPGPSAAAKKKMA